MCEAGQADPISHQPPRQHQRCDGRKPGSKTNPDADALPVGAEREPGADAEADAPIAEQCEDQGQRVSWSPRSMPAPMTCAPSAS